MYSSSVGAAFRSVFQKKFNVIAMVHVGGFPGSTNPIRIGKVARRAVTEAKIFKTYKCDGVLVENFYDTPYRRPQDLTPEVLAHMTYLTSKINSVKLLGPTGIQILAGCNMEAIAAAEATSCNFIRAEGLLYSHIADEGFIDGCAGALMRYKKQINSNALVLADIRKKYCSHAITADLDITEMVHAAEIAGVDAIVLTGKRTGDPVDLDEFHRVREYTKLPVIIGSGVTIDNVKDYIDADGVIVGTHFKVDGNVMETVCPKRVEAFMETVNLLRGPDIEEFVEGDGKMRGTEIDEEFAFEEESHDDTKTVRP